MRLYFDLEKGYFVTAPGIATRVSRVNFKRGDAASVEVCFYRGITGALLDSLPSLSFMIKEGGKYDGAALVSSQEWELATVAGEPYTCQPNFNTTELNSLLNSGDGDDSNDVAYVDGMLEVSWSEDFGETWHSSNTITARIDNDVIKGGEGEPISGSPSYPPAEEVIDTVEAVDAQPPVAASGVLTITGDVAHLETVTVGAEVFTFIEDNIANRMAHQATPDVIFVNTTGGVLSATDAAHALADALNVSLSHPPANVTFYNLSMLRTVTASASSGVLSIDAKQAGDAGNSIATSDTLSNGTWGAGGLSGGLPAHQILSRESLPSFHNTLSKADHVWLVNEESGDFHDVAGLMDLVNTNAVPGSAADSDFYRSRFFDDGSSQKGVGSAVALNGGPFAFALGFRISSTAYSSRAIAGQGDDSGAGVQWMLRRVSTSVCEFYITRAGGSGVHTVQVDGLQAGVAYTAVCRFDGTNLWLHVSDVGDAFEDASFGLWESDQVFALGYARQSGTEITNYFDGDIGWAAFWKGHLSDSDVRLLLSVKSTDLELEARRWLGIQAWGDSLSTSAFAVSSWAERVATDSLIGRVAEMHGVAGENSDGIRSRMEATPVENLLRGVVCIWAGNNNAADSAQVLSDVSAMRERVKAAGARKIILMGLPNRSMINSDQTTVDDLQNHLDLINSSMEDLAAGLFETHYLDVHDLFVNPLNYTPVDADDVADQTLGVVPRSARDDPSSTASTHLGDVGAQHLADAVVGILET